MDIIRLFLASPSDVVPERSITTGVVEELNKSMGETFKIKIELVKWEDFTGGMGRPQEVVNKQVKFEDIDIFVGTLWTRFGSKTGGINETTGKLYESGTEEEFQQAYDFWKSNNRPSILFYQSNKLINPATIDSDQYQKVREFFNQFKPDGKNPGLYYRYETELDFEKKLRIDLTRFIAERVKKNLLLK